MHSSNKIIFLAELIGTFGLVVAATGSMVYDVSVGGIYGHHFVVAMHLSDYLLWFMHLENILWLTLIQQLLLGFSLQSM